MMTNTATSDVEDQIKDILIGELYVESSKDQIGPDDSLREALGIDSLGFIELKEQIEKKFRVGIPEEDFTPENFATIATLKALIGRHRAPA